MKRIYPLIIDTDLQGNYGGSFPDIPGCVGAGTSIEECYEDSKKALVFHLAGMAEDGETAPEASLLEQIAPETDPDVHEVARLLVTVDLPGKRQRTNLTLDAAVLAAIDGVTGNRSAFLEDAAVEKLRRMQGQ